MAVKTNSFFRKQYKKLSQKLQNKFIERLEIFKDYQSHPQLNHHLLHHPYEGCRSINVSGDIRAIYEIKGNDIIFIRIG